MEKKYIFFESALALAVMFGGIAVLFAGTVIIAFLLPGNIIAVAVFVILISLVTISASFNIEKKEKK